MNKKVWISIIIIVILIAGVLDLMYQGLGYQLMPQFLKDLVDPIFGH